MEHRTEQENRIRNHWLVATLCNFIILPTWISIYLVLTSEYSKDSFVMMSFLAYHWIIAGIPVLIMSYASYYKRGLAWLMLFMLFNPSVPLGLILLSTGDTLWRILYGSIFIIANVWWYFTCTMLVKSHEKWRTEQEEKN